MDQFQHPINANGDDEAADAGAVVGGPGLGGLDPHRLILIVVGAHLRAEVGDRPIAYSIREKIINWQQSNANKSQSAGHSGAMIPEERSHFDVVVCSDVWYLNNESLRSCPTISIGGPGVNALAAFLADKLPHALVVDGLYLVQMDVELAEKIVSIWGMDHASTVTAADAFAARYLDHFMNAASRTEKL